MDRFNSDEDIVFNKAAESQGRWARLLGFRKDDPHANPYLENGPTSWLYRSFCAGWADVDQDPDAPKESIGV